MLAFPKAGRINRFDDCSKYSASGAFQRVKRKNRDAKKQCLYTYTLYQ